MGLFSLCLGGGSLILIGTWEAISSSHASLSPSPSTPLFSPSNTQTPPNSHVTPSPSASKSKPASTPFSSVTLISSATLSALFLLDSALSAADASRRSDPMGVALQLPSAAVSLLFLLFSASSLTLRRRLPPDVLRLLLLAAFSVELLLFSPLLRKYPSGVEIRYFNLLLIPLAACVVATVLELRRPSSPLPRLARASALVLKGSWLVQMAFSFFSAAALAQGCRLHQRSRGNYTLACSDHHRGMALATLQFNCHLAAVVVAIASLYSILACTTNPDLSRYRPIGDEMRQVHHNSRFTLDDSDEDNEILAADKIGAAAFAAHKSAPSANGFSHH